MYIKNFTLFSKDIKHINESSNSDNSGFSLAIVYDDKAEGGSKDLASKFIDELTKFDKNKANSELGQLDSAGASALSNWQKAWDARAKLDLGELKKLDNGWYVGKGAWRINSNKADFLGFTPSWMSWTDDLQDEILNAFFPELKGKEKVDTETSDEVESDELELASELEDELVASENVKLKYILRNKLFEQDDDFHLGPPKAAEEDADVVTPSDLIEELKRNYKMRHRANVMIWGAPGIGKTQIVKQAASSLEQELGKKIPVVIVTLSQMQPYDLNGIPLLFAKEGEQDYIMPLSKRGEVQMDFAIPAWLPGAGDEAEGILFFDEINRAQPDMLAAALTLLLDRKAQKYTMPSGWRVWGAGNRAMDGPVQPFEAAVASRFLGGHVHLVPTVDSWIDWARSDKAFYKDIDGTTTNEWYVPDEFIMFIKHAEGEGKDKDSIAKFFDLEGDPIQTKFKYFYDYDKSRLSSGGEGVTVGFPTPRNWAVAFQNIYETILTNKDYQDKISPDIDPKKKGIAALELAMQNKKDSTLIERLLKRVVGANATSAFMNYMKVLKRHSDDTGSLNEKLANIFKDPSKPRPLTNIAMVKDPSERYAILSLVEATIDGMGTGFTTKEFINWTKYLSDLKDKVKEGELGAHASSVISGGSEHVKKVVTDALKAAQLYKSTGEGKYKDTAMAVKPFIEQFREILSSFNI